MDVNNQGIESLLNVLMRIASMVDWKTKYLVNACKSNEELKDQRD